MPRVQKSKGVAARTTSAGAASTSTTQSPHLRRVRKYPGLLHPDSCFEDWPPLCPEEGAVERLPIPPTSSDIEDPERFAQGLKVLSSSSPIPLYCVGDVVRAKLNGTNYFERTFQLDQHQKTPTRVGEITRVFIEDGIVRYELKPYVETRAVFTNSRTKAATKQETARKVDVEAIRLRLDSLPSGHKTWIPGEEGTTMVVSQDRITWRLAIPNIAMTSAQQGSSGTTTAEGGEAQDAIMNSAQDPSPSDPVNEQPHTAAPADDAQEYPSNMSELSKDGDDVHDISPEGSPIPIYLIPAVNERVYTFVRKLKERQMVQRAIDEESVSVCTFGPDALIVSQAEKM